MSDQSMKKCVAVRVSCGGEAVTSVATFAALVCATHRPEPTRERTLEEEVLLELEALRARRGRAGRR